MAKLYAKLESDRKQARVIDKTGNEYIEMQLSNGNIRVFDITFRDDGNNRGVLEIRDYCNGSSMIVEYGGTVVNKQSAE